MPGSHKFTALCPNRHELTLWAARAGRCDGCHRFVADGEQVMDCRACNWYLCGDCRPNTSEQVENMWGAVSNLFFGDVCRAPSPHELEVAEVVVGPPAGSARAYENEEEPLARPPPPLPAPQQQEQRQHDQQQAASIAGAVGERSSSSEASVAVPPLPTPPVAPEEAPVEKTAEDEPVAAMLPPPPLAREMTDLIDLSVEPTAADPFDLSTIDFNTTEAPKKPPLDDGAVQVVAAGVVGGA